MGVDKNRLEELLEQKAVLHEGSKRNRELLKEITAEASKITARLHRKSIRKRKWLYVTTNRYHPEGIKYGAKLKVNRIGRKRVYLIYRGYSYPFYVSDVSAEKPDTVTSTVNNNVAKFSWSMPMDDDLSDAVFARKTR